MNNFAIRIPEFGDVLKDNEVTPLLARSDFDLESMTRNFNYRSEYIRRCGFVLWTESMMQQFKGVIRKNKWLEVMSGSGYLGTTMNKLHGTNIIMTDNHDEDWDKWHSDSVENLNAVDAIEKYHKEIKGVIMSWPPYDTSDAYEVAKKCYELNLPFIYIGEGAWGCTANDEFFEYTDERFECEPILENTFKSFEGIHDMAYLYTPIK